MSEQAHNGRGGIANAAERCGRRAADLVDEGDRALISGASAALNALLHTVAEHGYELAIVAPHAVADATICFIAGGVAGLDGSVAAPGAREIAKAARAAGIPVYALAPDGPVDRLPPDERIPAGYISAIVTARGIYRPERIARHREDGDTPFDIIPLQSSH